MHRIAKSQNPSAWQAAFLAMLPAIATHARVAFRRLDPEAKAEAIQEVVANAFVAFARLIQLGKIDIAYASPLARYAVAQVNDGQGWRPSKLLRRFIAILPTAEGRGDGTARPF